MPDMDTIEDLARLPAAAAGAANARREQPSEPHHGGASASPRVPGLGAFLRQLDVLIVLVAAPVAIVLGAPVLGCAIGAVAWVAQRVLARFDRRLLERARERGAPFGVGLVEGFGRIWLLAGAIVIAALAGGRADGLAASLIVFGAYSIAFTLRLLEGRPQQHGGAR